MKQILFRIIKIILWLIGILICLLIGYSIFVLIQLQQGKNLKISHVFLYNEDFEFSLQDSLHYFYEPRANRLQSYGEPRLPTRSTSTINKDSLNASRDYALSKEADDFRIVVLGDSSTFGVYVDTKYIFSEKLERHLNNEKPCSFYNHYDVINLAVPGYDIEYSIERYKKRGTKYNPDMIIWYIKNDDFYDSFELFRPIQEIYTRLIDSIHIRNVLEKNGIPYPEWILAKHTLSVRYILPYLFKYQQTRLEQFLSQQAPPILFISDTRDNNKIDTYIQKVVTQNRGRTYYESVSLEQLLRTPDGHPNNEGHDFIAKKLNELLRTKSMIPCIHRG